MEENLQLMAKKAWRLIVFMLKKSISKTKFLADLNIIIKRRKIAGKAFHTIFFHHHNHNHNHNHSHNWPASTTFPRHLPFPTSPSTDSEFSCTASPLPPLSTHNKHNTPPDSPCVRQLRITDSPFPLSNGDGDGLVDEAAEKFIMRFYNGLGREN